MRSKCAVVAHLLLGSRGGRPPQGRSRSGGGCHDGVKATPRRRAQADASAHDAQRVTGRAISTRLTSISWTRYRRRRAAGFIVAHMFRCGLGPWVPRGASSAAAARRGLGRQAQTASTGSMQAPCPPGSWPSERGCLARQRGSGWGGDWFGAAARPATRTAAAAVATRHPALLITLRLGCSAW